MLTRSQYRFTTFPDAWNITGNNYLTRGETGAVLGEDYAFMWESYLARRRMQYWNSEDSVKNIELKSLVPTYYNWETSAEWYDLLWGVVDEIAPINEAILPRYWWLSSRDRPASYYQYEYDNGAQAPNANDVFDGVMRAAYSSHFVPDGFENSVVAGVPYGIEPIKHVWEILRNTNRRVHHESGVDAVISGWTLTESGDRPDVRLSSVYGQNVLVGSGEYVSETENASAVRVAGDVSISVSVPSVISLVNYIGITLICSSTRRTSLNYYTIRVVWLPAFENAGKWFVESAALMAEAQAFYDSVEVEAYRYNMTTSQTSKVVTIGYRGYIDASLGHTNLSEYETF